MYWEVLRLPAPSRSGKYDTQDAEADGDDKNRALTIWVDDNNFKPNPAFASDEILFYTTISNFEMCGTCVVAVGPWCQHHLGHQCRTRNMMQIEKHAFLVCICDLGFGTEVMLQSKCLISLTLICCHQMLIKMYNTRRLCFLRFAGRYISHDVESGESRVKII